MTTTVHDGRPALSPSHSAQPAVAHPPIEDSDCSAPATCPLYHEAVELVGRRWTGAIVDILLQYPELRFSEIAQSIPQISDRLLSERMKELEARGIVVRQAHAGPPARVQYSLTLMGRALGPALGELKAWAQHWLA